MCETENKTNIIPIGDLEAILTEFGASDGIARLFAKRVGGVIGSNGITPEIIRQAIIDNLYNGLPNWPKINDILGDAVTRVYHGKKPFSKPL